MNLADMLRKVSQRRAAAADALDAAPASGHAKRGAPPATLKKRLTPDAAYADGRDTIHFTQFFRSNSPKVSGK